MLPNLKTLAVPLKWIWANTEPLTKWIQVLALSVAAYWTYTRFLVGEKPSLETRLDITSNLRWEDRGPRPETCYVFFDVEVKNEGRVSFDVERPHIRAWRSDPPKPVADVAQYIDMEEFENGSKVIDNSDSRLLNMHFAPGERAWRTFSWVFRAQPPGVYLFRIDMDALHDREVTHVNARSWGQDICPAGSAKRGKR
jgi:hypothetical protein